MTTGMWISLGIFLFLLGSIMALQPSAKQKALGRLRDMARKAGLNPRLVPCPQWLINPQGKKGEGMVPLYGVILPNAKLPVFEALVIDGVMEVTKGNHKLHEAPCAVDGVLGITMQANFAGIYWNEKVALNTQVNDDMRKKKLADIKENLQMWVKKVQA